MFFSSLFKIIFTTTLNLTINVIINKTILLASKFLKEKILLTNEEKYWSALINNTSITKPMIPPRERPNIAFPIFN